ncbi:MAG TPA: TolC family protein [Caulobacterales bacterium]|nr:TolC family protein [Caulobacterales bacterium]
MAALALVCACSTMPAERAEAPPLPSAWRDAPTGADLPVTDWWTQFDDPLLDRLEAEALSSGPDVQLAISRLRQARAQSRTTVTQYLPQLTLTGQGQYTRALDDASLPMAGGGSETVQMVGAWGPQVTWEVPLFGRIEAAAAGARANNRSALADLRAARVAVAADVAQAYVDLRAARASYAALTQSVDSADQLARILETGADAGLTAPADAANARRLAETARARLPGLEIEARRAENVLAVLRGLSPGTEPEDVAQAFAATTDNVPSLPLRQAPAAPADLLRLRPDVARAEAQALLAAAALGSARSDLFPQLNLTGTLSATSNLVGSALPAGEGRQVTATPFISLPLFDWGQRFAQVGVRHEQFAQSLILYKQTVTQAVAEASNALISLSGGERRLEASRAAETAAQASDRGSRASYEAGIQSLADRLQVQQQLIDATLSRIDAEHQQASAAIAVYRAFGGGPALN